MYKDWSEEGQEMYDKLAQVADMARFIKWTMTEVTKPLDNIEQVDPSALDGLGHICGIMAGMVWEATDYVANKEEPKRQPRSAKEIRHDEIHQELWQPTMDKLKEEVEQRVEEEMAGTEAES